MTTLVDAKHNPNK